MNVDRLAGKGMSKSPSASSTAPSRIVRTSPSQALIQPTGYVRITTPTKLNTKKMGPTLSGVIPKRSFR